MGADNEGVFISTGKSLDDANYLMHMPEHGHRSWDTFATGYRRAAEALSTYVSSKSDDVGLVNTVGLPLIFLWRHYLELRLKGIIISGRENPSGHCLSNNWNTIIGMIRKINGGVAVIQSEKSLKITADMDVGKIAQSDYDNIRLIVTEFDSYDRNSETFRYPDIKRAGLWESTNINLKYLAQSMPGVADLLDKIYSYLSIYYDVEHEYDYES